MRRARLPFVLPVASAIAAAIVLASSTARADTGGEVSTDLSISREYVWLTTDARVDLRDGLVGLGLGAVLISNFRASRAGARALVQVASEHVTVSVQESWAPAQDGRGWLGVEPRIAWDVDAGRVQIEGEVSAGVRHVDVDAPANRSARAVSVVQLQTQAELTLTVDEEWHLVLHGGRSLYDPDLSSKTFVGADLGPLVTWAGHPETWVLGGRAATMLGPGWRLELGVAGVVYADVAASAVVPRLAVRAGPWRKFSVEVVLDVAVAVTGAASEPVRPMGGLTLTWER